jgi:hypothetical protein
MGVNAIALVLVASFAIDRIVNFLLFALSYNRWWKHRFPEPESVKGSAAQIAAEKKHKAVYFALAAPIGIIVLSYFGQVRVLNSLGVPAAPILDIFLTGLVLMGGADRIAEIMKMAGVGGGAGIGEKTQPPHSIEVKGTLTLGTKAA